MLFSDLFRSDSSTRDKFLSRLFGIFSEEIVRCWASAPEAPYEDLGRPTVKAPTNESRGYTLDFTFRSKADDAIYIVEMKSELQYQNYKYLILSEPSQLNHHMKKPAFHHFLEMAKSPKTYQVEVNGKPQEVDGSVLIWGSYNEIGRKDVRDRFGFADILSVENIVNDLNSWNNEGFSDLINRYDNWSSELFDGLLSEGSQG